MKDIYDLLNGIEVHVSGEMEASAWEKEKIKRNVKISMEKRKKRSWKRILIAASFTLLLFAGSLFGLSFTTLADESSFLSSIYNLFSKTYDKFAAEAQPLNLVAEDNEVKISIEDAVFDGKNFFVTFILESEVDLPEEIWLEDKLEITIENRVLHGLQYNHHVKLNKIAEKQYAGLLAGNIKKLPIEQADFSWKINKIMSFVDDENDKPLVEGNWEFSFSLDAMDTTVQTVTAPTHRDVSFLEMVQREGFFTEINQITYTPVSFIISYTEFIALEKWEEWDFVYTVLEVHDDLGNEYTGRPWYGVGDRNDFYSRMKLMQIFNQLDPNASQLIITPVVKLKMADGVGKNGGLYRAEDSTAPAKEIKLDTIIIDIEI